MRSSLPVVLFLVPFVSALLVVIFGWWIPRLARWIASSALITSSVLSLIALDATRSGPLRVFLGGWPAPLGIEWSLDFLGALMTSLVSCSAAIVLLGAGPLVRAELEKREVSFYACSLLLISGLIGMASTADLFNFYVHLEVSALSAYALVGAGGRGAPRAAIRYLIVGTLGASLYLLGVGFLYAATGSLNMADVATRLAGAPRALSTTGSILIMLGLALKMGLVPLHAWMPEAYAKAPAAAAALMAPVVTKVSAYALLRMLYWVCAPNVLPRESAILESLILLGAVTMLYGSGRAVFEQNLRRALAFSSISQIGLVAVGIGLATPNAMTGAIVHLLADALAKAALFLAAGSIAVQYGIHTINELGRMRSRARWIRVSIGLAGLSLIGIPPFIGFFGKWYVLLAAVEGGAYLIAAAVVAGSLLTSVLVFRILEKIFFGAPTALNPPKYACWSVATASFVFAMSTSVFGLLSTSLIRWIATTTFSKGG
jgi:multicomponent Na+:H+ antiporter subunit D